MVDVLHLEQALQQSERLNAEVGVRRWLHESTFEVGVIAFHQRTKPDPRQILHPDRDVVCQVLGGCGWLGVGRDSWPVAPGALYRIRAGTPHDFAATGPEPLVLLYTLIKAMLP